MTRLALVLVMGLTLAGCKVSGQTPRHHKAKIPDASGRKLIVVDANGNALGKLRLRKDRMRVYGPDMMPFGMVARDEAGMGFTPHGQITTQYLTPDTHGIWESAESLRIEPVDRGWAVFGADATLIGYVEFSGTWTFRSGYDDSPKWVTKGRDIMAGAEKICTGWSAENEPEMTLALCIEGLPLESRALLGAWLKDQESARATTAK